MKYQQIDQAILDYAGVERVFPFGDEDAIYQVVRDDSDPHMFAVVTKESKPLRISLKIDPILAQTLRDRYEEVQGAEHLNQKYWITIINTGQMSDDEIFDLVRLSYNLAAT